MIKFYIREFLKTDAAGGILLTVCALLAILAANSPIADYYNNFLDIPVGLQIGALEIDKPLLLWINDGLMAIFFILVGLEVKREVLVGELSKPSQVMLPAIGALGGIAVPALIFAAMNQGDPEAMRGWAIPVATDIAFAVGALSLLNNRVPKGLKLFLLTLAIIDDLGAIIIIAVFYSHELSMGALMVAAGALAVLIAFNWKGVSKLSAYLIVGFILWVAVLKSGIHATIAGVLLAFCIPLRTKDPHNDSPLESLEHDLNAPVAYLILPLFAFANAGLNLSGIGLDAVTHPVTLGIAFGLLFGKVIGVFAASWLTVALKLATLPAKVRWSHMLGVSALCGIGFTMSLFVASLSYPSSAVELNTAAKLGILSGSLLSAFIGYWVLRLVSKPGDADSSVPTSAGHAGAS